MNHKKHPAVKQKVKPKVRQAEIEDFDKVYPLLKEMNSTRLSKEDWFRLFQNHWSIDEFSPGIVLELDDKIVGYIGTIYSRQFVDGQPKIFCNLTTWIVQDEFRSHSIMMIFSLVRNKNIVLTSFSSDNVTYEVYKKLGFKDGNQEKRIIYPFPSFRAGNYQLTDNIKMIKEAINIDKNIFNDHCSFKNSYILIKYKYEVCLLMGVTRKKVFKLYYASNKSFFQKHLKYFRNKLMSKVNVKKIQADEQLLNDASLFFSRKVIRGNPYQYKTSDENISSPTPIYSEIFLLNM